MSAIPEFLSLDLATEFISKDCNRIRDRLNFASDIQHEIIVQMNVNLWFEAFKIAYRKACFELQLKRRKLERKLKVKLLCKDVCFTLQNDVGMRGPHLTLTSIFYEVSKKRPFSKHVIGPRGQTTDELVGT